ncbi:glycosyltransferase [Brevundimonas sp.]|uniref:glycosyltransferase n=1 Tax=Brevundimonas sp. TaxID=1871086 RepID=UPI002E15BD6D|nr:glycosyltransferase [Brevundimonas sp.]
MSADGEERRLHVFALETRDSARMRGLSSFQWASAIVFGLVVALGLAFRAEHVGTAALIAAHTAFGFSAAWRIVMAVASLKPSPIAPEPARLPSYAVLVALHDESEVVPQLVSALSRIDYPGHLLEGFLLLETHDQATREAIEAVTLPAWLRVLVVPPGSPTTKPRALNYGLARCRADLVTVYDAEDRPHPLQLREAAARFSGDVSRRLACLQAPLRVLRVGPSKSPMFDRQFALEYAALFEVMLPGLARLGLPFPLGGTSNHFRADVLRAIGGWDAHNVTEDADLGFRLHREGWRMDVITRATIESPPGDLQDWLPQRVRWMKGFMQTWGVHTRRPWTLGARGGLSLVMTLGMALAAAAAHAPSVAWVTASVLVAAVMGLAPATPPGAMAILTCGMVCAWLTIGIGARRAGLRCGLRAMIESPAYWSILTLAFGHAVWRLISEPFLWDKTRHRPDVVPDAGPEGSARPISIR